MQSTMNPPQRIANPRDRLTAGEEETIVAAYVDAFGGRKAADAKYTGSGPLLPLRLMARAEDARVPGHKILALYETYHAVVVARCLTDPRPLGDVSLAEQRSNWELDEVQLMGTSRLSIHDLLTWDAKARGQSAATFALRAAIHREMQRAKK